MLRLIERTDGRFRVSYAVTGVAIEQMKLYAPEVLDSFVRLAKTGAVELIAETYYHSLAALYDKDEYREQIDMETEAHRVGVRASAARLPKHRAHLQRRDWPVHRGPGLRCDAHRGRRRRSRLEKPELRLPRRRVAR